MMKVIIEDRDRNGVDFFCSTDYAFCRITISNKCPNVAFISNLVVDRKRRGGKLAVAMIAEVECVALEQGCGMISLEVKYNSWKAKFYRRLGYTPVCDNYSGDLITMSKRLYEDPTQNEII